MDKRQLGQTDIEVSILGLGTVKFGRNEGVKYPSQFDIPDESALAALLSLAKDLGINMLDTAPSYGQSEERLGRLLKGSRTDWVIVGKAGEDFEDGISAYNFSASHFEASLERSLKRLQTDYLDVLLIHSDGDDMKILSNESLLEKMYDFRERGLVRAIGASTKSVEGGIMALELFDVVMAAYNPDYTDEKPVIDYGLKNNKGVLLKKALSSGHMDMKSGDPVQKAMDFAFAHRGVTSVIAGTINPEHLKANVRAAIKATQGS